jgi:hypothetical protein
VVQQAAQVITFDPLPVKGVGDVPFAVSASISSGLTITYVSSNPLVASVSGNTITILNTGSAIISASQNGNANYLPATPVQQPLTVVTKPFVLSPKDGAIDQSTSLVLKSQVQTGAENYTIEVCLSNDFSSGVISKTGPNLQEFSGLAYNTKYFARVKTNLTDYGKITSFTTIDPVSLAFVVSPKDGSKNVATSPILSSNIVPGATSYTIELSMQPWFPADSTLLNSSSTNSVSFAGLVYSTLYYARVQTDVALGHWGAITTFTTAKPSKKSSALARTVSAEDLETREMETQLLTNSYPNPFGDELTVHVQTEVQEKLQVHLYHLTGKETLRQEALTNMVVELETSALPRGMYFLKVVTAKRIMVKKLLKE